MATVGELVAKLKADTSQFDKKMKEATKQSKSFGDQLKTVGKVGAVAFAAVAGAALLVVREINQMTKELDGLAKQARVLDIQVSSLQFLKFAADRAGVSYGMLTSTMERLAFRVNEASRGNKMYQASLKELNLDAATLTKLPIDEQLRRVSSALKSIPNRADQINIIRQLGGREAVKLLNLVNEDVDTLAKTFQRMNLQLSSKQSQDIENYDDSITNMTTAWDGFKQQITAGVVPAFTELLDGIFNTTTGFTDLREAAREVAAFILDVTASMIEGVQRLITVLDKAIDKWRELQAGERVKMVHQAAVNAVSNLLDGNLSGFSVDPSMIGKLPDRPKGGMSKMVAAITDPSLVQNTRQKAADLRNPTLQGFMSITDNINSHFGKLGDAAGELTKKMEESKDMVTGMIRSIRDEKVGQELERILGTEIREAFGGLSRDQIWLNENFAKQVRSANPNMSEEDIKKKLPFQEQRRDTGRFDADVRTAFANIQAKRFSESDFDNTIKRLQGVAVSLGPQFTGVIDELKKFGEAAGLVKDKAQKLEIFVRTEKGWVAELTASKEIDAKINQQVDKRLADNASRVGR